MTLQHTGDDGGGFERCVHCGGLAAGPCARCGRSVCGDCTVLTEGGAGVWAVCTACNQRGGRSLSAGWRAALLFLLAPIFALVAVILLLEWFFS